MGRAYSNDLRERVVRAVTKGGLSRHQQRQQCPPRATSRVFGAAFPETGSMSGQIEGLSAEEDCGATPRLAGATLPEGGFHLAWAGRQLAERGLNVDYHTVSDFVHAEKLSHKKRR